jgi:hypothetical protein
MSRARRLGGHRAANMGPSIGPNAGRRPLTAILNTTHLQHLKTGLTAVYWAELSRTHVFRPKRLELCIIWALSGFRCRASAATGRRVGTSRSRTMAVREQLYIVIPSFEIYTARMEATDIVPNGSQEVLKHISASNTFRRLFSSVH